MSHTHFASLFGSLTCACAGISPRLEGEDVGFGGKVDTRGERAAVELIDLGVRGADAWTAVDVSMHLVWIVRKGREAGGWVRARTFRSSCWS